MTETTPTRTNLKVYTLYVAGIFGRNRKAKNGMFNLAEQPEGAPLDLLAVTRLTLARLEAEKVKPGAVYNVVESDEYREDRGDGIQVRGFMLGGAHEVLKRATWTPGGECP